MSETIILNREAIKKNNLTEGEALILIAAVFNISLEGAEKSLKLKGLASNIYDKDTFKPIGLFATKEGVEVFNSLICDSDKKINTIEEKELVELANTLRTIYPQGKKEGTNKYWTEGPLMIVKRLKTFFKKYGYFTPEQIIAATESYVKGFNTYQYMKTLRYFIWNEKLGASGEAESESLLYDYIMNAGQEEAMREDWTSSLN